MTGKLIILEGLDGSGKSTQAEKLSEWLNTHGHKTIHTREPEIFREILLTSQLTPLSELLIFLADRSEHISRVIMPAIISGINVICERWNASTLAYQKHPNAERLISLCSFPNPDIEIYFDISPNEALKRLQRRGKLPDNYEQRGITYLKEVSLRYEKLITGRKMTVIKSEGRTIDEIFTELKTIAMEKICQSR